MSLQTAVKELFTAGQAKVNNLLDHGSVNESRVVIGVAFVALLLWLTHGQILPYVSLIAKLVAVVMVCTTVTKVAYAVMNGLIRIQEIKQGINQPTITTAAGTTGTK